MNRSITVFVVACAGALLAACMPNINLGRDGGVGAPVVTAINPNSAALDQSHSFDIDGTNFVAPARVLLGAYEAKNVTVVSPVRISAWTDLSGNPPPGTYDVKVINPDNEMGTLAKAFTFTQAGGTGTISDCFIQWPKTNPTWTKNATTIYGHVTAPNITNVSGAPQGLTGQIGYGVAGTPTSQWTWFPASYNPGCTTCDATTKEYEGSLPEPTQNGGYQYAYRFQVQDGSWVMCDQNGIWNGGGNGMPGTFTIGTPPTTINGCNLQYPASISGDPGTTSPQVYGHVNSTGNTGKGTATPGMVAQVGFGAQGTAPATWTNWTNGAYNANCTTCPTGYDEYSATFPLPSTGSYDYAYRFQLNNGSYYYCDLNGIDPGGAYDNALGTMSTSSNNGPWCTLWSMDNATVPSGSALTITGSIYVPLKTGFASAASGIYCQGGIGNTSTVDSSWAWKAAQYTGPGSYQDDSYTLTMHPSVTGNRSVNMRCTPDNGSTWIVCGQSVYANSGSLYVTTNWDYCDMEYPASVSVAGTKVYGQVQVTGITDSMGKPSSIVAQLGYGNVNTDPDLSWTWVNATYNQTNINKFEYDAPFPSGLKGNYGYAMRYAMADGGTSIQGYCYGDLATSPFSFGYNYGSANF